MQRATFLGALVLGNVALAAAGMAAGFVVDRGGQLVNYSNPGFMATYGIVFTQLWVLALFTAFYDPRHRPTRWLAILLALSLFTAAFYGAHWGLYADHVYAIPWLRDRDSDYLLIAGFMQRTIFSIPAIFVSLALIILIQSVCWPLRSALGWQISMDERPTASSRQFGMTNLLAWLGFFSAFFYLVTLFRDNSLFYAAVLICVVGMAASLPVAVAWTFLLKCRRVRIMHVIFLALGIALLCFLENEAIFIVNQRAVMAGARAAVAPFWMPLLVSFNCAAGLTALINLLVLRGAGARLQSLPPKQHAVPTQGREQPAMRTA